MNVPANTAKPLTTALRAALLKASRKDGATIAAPFRTLAKHDVSPGTADRLVALGLAVAHEGVLRVTRAGTHALSEPVAATPRFLAKTTGYTNVPALGMPDEPEAVDAATQERITERRLMSAEQRRVAQLVEARVGMEAMISALEPLIAEDRRVGDRVRLIRRSVKAIDEIVRRAA